MVKKTLYTELKKAEDSSEKVKWGIIEQFKSNPLVQASINGEGTIENALTTALMAKHTFHESRELVEQSREYLAELIPSIFNSENVQYARYLDKELKNPFYRSSLPYGTTVKISSGDLVGSN
ncbi:hypothetical protein ACFLZJ_00305 [Nanoarchaeota archaeon]